MAIQEVKDVAALPFAEDVYAYWVRHKIDPTVLINGRSGDCYARRDGLRWEHPAYQVNRKGQPANTIQPHTAPEDFEIYSPTTKRSAA